jgi:AcrR family transcriptional regulator
MQSSPSSQSRFAIANQRADRPSHDPLCLPLFPMVNTGRIPRSRSPQTQIRKMSRPGRCRDVPRGRRYPAAVRASSASRRKEALSGGGSLALGAALDGDARLTRTQATPAAAFRSARRMYLEGRRVDMIALANELGVSRTTLYRWTGHREQLLADILWSLSNEIFERAKADHPEHTGPERLLAIFRQHVGALVAAQPLHTFLRQETHAALRILTARDGGVQRRTVDSLAQLYREEVEAGSFEPRAEVRDLAYAVVRVTEGLIYNDAIVAGASIVTVEPEVEQAAQIVALLLQ